MTADGRAGSNDGASGGDGENPRRTPAAATPWIAPEIERAGILGGTFDPIHYGHLAIAEQVREELGLERVLFVPAARPPHKQGEAVAPIDDRVAMVRLAIADNARFTFCGIELERRGLSYTADTLAELTQEAARQRVARRLFFILSAEALLTFAAWHEPERVLALADLAVVARPGTALPSRDWLAANLPGGAASLDRVHLLDTASVSNSSSDIRGRVAAGRTIRYLVPPVVEAYIRDHRLYRSTRPQRIA